jgi:hypothetical protein
LILVPIGDEEIGLEFRLGTDWTSRAIAWWGQGYGGWSHVDAVLRSGELLGARSDRVKYQGTLLPSGVQIRPASYEQPVRYVKVAIRVGAQRAADWEGFLRSQVPDPYDKADILGLIAGRPWMTAGHWICSALQTDALNRIKLFKNNPLFVPQQVAPNTLLFGVLSRDESRIVEQWPPLAKAA